MSYIWDITDFTQLTLWHPAGFGDFHAKTIRSHVALRMRNSGAESSRAVQRLKRHSKSSSLHSKNFFCLGGVDFL